MEYLLPSEPVTTLGCVRLPAAAAPRPAAPTVRQPRRARPAPLQGKVHQLEVAEDETVLDVALDHGLDVPYDCKMGVCL